MLNNAGIILFFSNMCKKKMNGFQYAVILTLMMAAGKFTYVLIVEALTWIDSTRRLYIVLSNDNAVCISEKKEIE